MQLSSKWSSENDPPIGLVEVHQLLYFVLSNPRVSMTPQQFSIVSLRLFGLWSLAMSLLIAWQRMSASSAHSWPYLGYIIYSGVMASVSYLCFYYAYPLGTFLSKGATVQQIGNYSSTEIDRWSLLGCGLLGLWFSISAIPGVIVDIYLSFIEGGRLQMVDRNLPTPFDHLLYNALQLLIGCSMIKFRALVANRLISVHLHSKE
jgi:uncharacterized membrane protein